MTPEQMVERAEALARESLAWDMADWSGWTEREMSDVFTLVLYIRQTRDVKRREAQRRAMRLLRSWLPEPQRRRLSRNREFKVRGSAGGRYRLYPSTGTTSRIRRHGTRDFAVTTYCLHPPDVKLPPADISLAHYLLIVTDEPRFLATANATDRMTQLWNGDYLRRLRANRMERER
jgi:hypothetical protein